MDVLYCADPMDDTGCRVDRAGRANRESVDGLCHLDLADDGVKLFEECVPRRWGRDMVARVKGAVRVDNPVFDARTTNVDG